MWLMEINGVDLSRYPSLREIASSPPHGWTDSGMPLARRGVRVS